jgi:hypothetical protein
MLIIALMIRFTKDGNYILGVTSGVMRTQMAILIGLLGGCTMGLILITVLIGYSH